MFEYLDDPLEFVPPESFRRRVTDRGRQLRARRRLTAVATTTVVVSVLVAAVLVAGAGRDGDGEVRTGPSEEPREPRLAIGEAPLELPPEKLVRVAEGVTAAPASDLRDGDVVTLDLATPTLRDDAMAFVCAAEVLDHLDEWLAGMEWCSEPSVVGATDRADVTVARQFRTAGGRVDCSDAPGRCVVAVADGPVAGLRYAPLAMAGGLGEDATQVRVYGADEPLHDGDDIRIEAEGFPAWATVRIELCTPEVCDQSMRGVSVTADREGRLELDFRVFHEFQHTFSDGVETPAVEWVACTDCRLDVGDGVARLSLPVEIVPPAEPIRPQVTVEGIDGPLEPGSTVRVTGEGFQPGVAAGLTVGWCPNDPVHLEVGVPSGVVGGCEAPPEGRPQNGSGGVDGPGRPSLVLNDDGFVVDEDGRFVIEEFPLPDEGTTLGDRLCTARPGNCTITWGESFQLGLVPLPAEQVLPLDLSG
jgi:hypothetical protein